MGHRVIYSVAILPSTKREIARLSAGQSVGEFVDQMVERESKRPPALGEVAEFKLLSEIGSPLAFAIQYLRSGRDPTERLQAANRLISERVKVLRPIVSRATKEAADDAYVAAGNTGPKTWKEATTYSREREYEAIPDALEESGA
jgi:hypothetical protein